MTGFAIRTFGDPVLRQRAREVTDLDGDLARLVDAMRETMHEARGVGLAAPQIGVQKRLYTYDVEELIERGATAPGPGVLVNPEIVETEGEWSYEEGCLSVPGLAFELVRPNRVTVRGLDLDGHEIVLEGDELMGRMIQHEIDHLDGILVIDRVDPETRKEALRELRTRDFDARATGGDHRL
ncbi:MAG TPA: peptide deformylase [Acidimicrobiia bacterium]|nr:peptide deformylase [Acidimicrobiia bacterium]